MPTRLTAAPLGLIVSLEFGDVPEHDIRRDYGESGHNRVTSRRRQSSGYGFGTDVIIYRHPAC